MIFFSDENKQRTNENRQKTLAVLLHHTFKKEPMHEINTKYIRIIVRIDLRFNCGNEKELGIEKK